MVKLAVVIAVLAAGLQDTDGAGCTEKKTLMKFSSFGKTKEKGASGCQTACSGTSGCAFWNFAPKLGECKLQGVKSFPSKTRVSGKKDCNMLTCKSAEIDKECINYKTYLKPFVVDRMKKIGSDEECAKNCDSAYQCMFWVYWPKRQICRLSGLKRMKNKFRTSGKMSCKGACGPTLPPTTTVPLPPQCSNYNVLDDPTRLYSLSSSSTSNFMDLTGVEPQSPDWNGNGYYRFMSPAGTKLAEYDATTFSCSQYGTTWSVIGNPSLLPTTIGETIELTLVGQYYNNVFTLQLDSSAAKVEVTNCGDFYVYKLENVGGSAMRFCGSE